jgi:antitoxin PrlF
MAPRRTRITSQGQVSVPAEVRRKLGVGPGAVLEWDDKGGEVVVRRAGNYSFDDVHRAVFERPPKRAKDLAALKEGVRKHIRKKHARG